MPETIVNNTGGTKIENNRLFGRRQYVLGSHIIKDLKNWKSLEIDHDLFLTYHPDLDVEYVRTNSDMFILLGIILDPFNPELSNREVLLNLSKSCSFEELIENTDNLAGRWIIIYNNNNRTNVFHDAAGARQVFYSYVKGKTWCSSQPHLIAEHFNINKTTDREVLDFMSSSLYNKSEHAWIGDDTFYDGIYHLLPNHFLDIRRCEVKRYWPNKNFKIREISIDQSIEHSSKILQGMMESISLRFPIMLAVTAGIDSRVLLAASKTIKDEVYYFIQEFSANTGSNDIIIPARLLKKLQLEFHVEKCEEKIEDEEFNQIFNKNIYIFQSETKKVLHYNFYKKFQDKIFISGNASGIAKNFYGLNNDINNLNSSVLAKYFGREGDKYSIRKIDEWLLDAVKPAEESGIGLLALFYWEQRMGNWGAMFCADNDIANEIIYAYNCRKLLITLRSVKIKYRLSDNVLYKELIKKMWKEALSEPINPESLQVRIINRIINIKMRLIEALKEMRK